MRKTALLLLVVIMALTVLCFVGCNKNQNEVIITIDKKYDLSNGNTLEDYMEYLEEKGKLEFEEEDGMIIEINGIKNTLNSYWMLYTNDNANSNSAWGTYEYKDQTFGSATLGAESLIINKDYTYVWVYQTF